MMVGMTPPRKKMPQTIAEYQHLLDSVEKVMLEDRATISKLKDRLNKYVQKNPKHREDLT